MLLIEPTVQTGDIVIPRLSLFHGGELRDVRIAYQVHGDENSPAIVALGGISAGRQITPGWWQDFVGPDKAIDTEQFCVIGIDFLGGCGASNRANSVSFPAISSVDQANAVHAVLDHLGVDRLAAFIGSSYGGMVALAFGEHHPSLVDRLIVISAAHQPHPMATALRSLQRRTIRFGLQNGAVADAVAIARGIAMTTYRTSSEFAQRFDVAARHDGHAWRHPVEDYIEQRGREFAHRFDPHAFLCLSQSGDLHNVNPAHICIPVTLVAVDGDTLVHAWQMQQLAQSLAGDVELHTISSIYGHDAFLKEVDAISSILRSTLSLETES